MTSKILLKRQKHCTVFMKDLTSLSMKRNQTSATQFTHMAPRLFFCNTKCSLVFKYKFSCK